MELLSCKYILDSTPMSATPAQLLEEVSPIKASAPSDEVIVDDTPDPGPGGHVLELGKWKEYLAKVQDIHVPSRCPLSFAAEYARFCVYQGLLDAIWTLDSFVLEDVRLSVQWFWNADALGRAAAFYQSVQSACELVDCLNVRLDSYSVQQSDDLCLQVQASGLSLAPKLSSVIVPDTQSWIVYIPFETSLYRLGGSALAAAHGWEGGTAPSLDDPDYFMDCYEVVREMVSDGVLLSGCSVRQGGLAVALNSFCGSDYGLSADILPLAKALDCDDSVRILFAEVPGVLVQISDDDFDYLDSQLLLQDVMYFPLGHPVHGGTLEFVSSSKTGIESILASLLR